MAGAVLIGFFAGSGMWLTLLILLAIRALFLSSIEILATIHFNYRQRHPKKAHNPHTFWIIWAIFMATIALYHWIWG
jgi:hypothetical protein